MAPFTPVTLSGDNLGQRHRHLNSLVRQAAETDVESLAEHTPVDRLFKIDLAVRQKHLPYIIHNLKDDDVLFVSRALKAKWLVDHRDIINPKYLEDVLFPQMVTPAVTKIKHWLYINLRVPAMCQEFYQYYKQNTFEFAIKFLSHCSHEFILEEVPNILTKLTTHYLKVLCEKYPTVAKIYFDSLSSDEDLRGRYLEQEQSYYNSVKCVLKSDADIFLDITEKYFNIHTFNRFSPLATEYILRCQKSRFINKLELYVDYILHIPTIAAHLSAEECQQVVVKLARAKYLQYHFEYKLVEPLIKRLRPDKRAAFKKRVFVEKDVGELVTDWPYDLPSSPPSPDTDTLVFDDMPLEPVFMINNQCLRMERCGGMLKCCMALMEDKCMIRIKTDLERLFDEYRFIGFDRALHVLGEQLGATGSTDRRRDIFLVLVSKSGGRIEAISALLRLAARHSNEPAHTRASILRSLVKRACVWRLPAEDWQLLLDFGHGLGLDGGSSEAPCHEGLHAVVIRQLLVGENEQKVCVAFLNNFSTLAEYPLKAEEKVRVIVGLQNMLTEAAIGVEPTEAAKHLNKLLDVIKTYHVRVEADSPVVKAVRALALRNADVGRPLLEQLYNERIARRELMRLNLEFRRDEQALLNALRHEPSALDLKRVVDILASRETRFDGFSSKLVVYFDQETDFAAYLRTALKEEIVKISEEKGEKEATKRNQKLVRPLASLLGKELEKELKELDTAGKERVKFAAALRACAHRARFGINLAEWGWRKAGVKAVATRAMRCREVDRAELTRALASDRRTVRLALALSMRSTGGLLLDAFASAAKLRPVVALHVALPYFRRSGASTDTKVWDIVKPLFSSVDLSSRERLRQLLGNTDWIPSAIKPDYCISLYLAICKISKSRAYQVLRDLSTLLPECGDAIEPVLLQLLDSDDKNAPASRYSAMFVRYLLLSSSDTDLDSKFQKIGAQFLETLNILRSKKDRIFEQIVDQVIKSLKYNAAFFDTKYTSLSVIERVLSWMQKFMPKEEYFDKYVHIHLTMLYCKAVQQCVKQMPQVFADPKRKRSEGVEAVGFVFGRYIAKEVAKLVGEYFDSIIEVYADALVEYSNEYMTYGSSRAKFLGSMLKGLWSEGLGAQRRIAVFVLKDQQYDLDEAARKEIKELINQDKDKAIEFFFHSELMT